jgi:hypothetical protein
MMKPPTIAPTIPTTMPTSGPYPAPPRSSSGRHGLSYLAFALSFIYALQAPLQKIDLQHLLADLPLQLGNPSLRPAPLSISRKRVARPLPELTPPAVQHVGMEWLLTGEDRP